MLNPSGYPFAPVGIVPETWFNPTTAWDVRDYSDIELQFVGTITTPYQPQRSLDGTNFVNTLAFDQAGNSYTTITSAGIYSLDGSGYLRFSAGAGTVVTRRAGV